MRTVRVDYLGYELWTRDDYENWYMVGVADRAFPSLQAAKDAIDAVLDGLLEDILKEPN